MTTQLDRMIQSEVIPDIIIWRRKHTAFVEANTKRGRSRLAGDGYVIPLGKVDTVRRSVETSGLVVEIRDE